MNRYLVVKETIDLEKPSGGWGGLDFYVTHDWRVAEATADRLDEQGLGNDGPLFRRAYLFDLNDPDVIRPLQELVDEMDEIDAEADL